MKQVSAKLKGVIVPMVTPFDENENVDEEALRRLVRWLITQDVSGLYPGSGCGEVWKVSLEERLRIIEIVGKEAHYPEIILLQSTSLDFSRFGRENRSKAELPAERGQFAALIMTGTAFHSS